MRARYDASALDDLLRALDARPASAPAGLDDLSSAIFLGDRIARRAGVHPDTCLFRALARYALLRSGGHVPRFVIGIDALDPARGHAWIELAGQPFLERSSPAFRRTFEHPAGA